MRCMRVTETEAVCGILGESCVKASLCSHAGQIGTYCSSVLFTSLFFYRPFTPRHRG